MDKNDNSLVTGPTNLIRLEGIVFGIKKVLYLFMDKHLSVESQTKCDKTSEHITKYVMNNIDKNKSNILDLFLEVDISRISNKINIKHNRYIDEMVKAFEFNYDEKKKKMYSPKKHANLRLHYIDFRTFFFNDILIIADSISGLLSFNNFYLTGDNYKKLSYQMYLMKRYLLVLYNTLYKTGKHSQDLKIKPESKEDNIVNKLKEYVNKIQNKYNHDKVKIAINDHFATLQICLDMMLDKLAEMRLDLDKIIDIEKDDMTVLLKTTPLKIEKVFRDVYYSNEIIYYASLTCFSNFIDLFFLRRFLDKDYITNAITYTGSFHSLLYIHFLINNFDFQITNVAYSSIKDLKKLNKEIKGMPYKNYTNKMADLFIAKDLKQCIDISSFPKNFQ